MKKTIAMTLSAFLVGAIGTGVLVARAQTPAPPPGPEAGARVHSGRGAWADPDGDRDDSPTRWGWRMRERGGHPGGAYPPGGMRAGMMGDGHGMEMMRTFALVPRADDRKLTPPDVTRIAEGFLLFRGNHTWKVLNSAMEGDVIGFDLATKEGSVIAHFTMDPRTGHVKRVS